MKKMFTKVPLFIFAFILFIQAQAQIIEAETATLAGGAAIQTDASASGGAYVAQGEGNLTFNVNLTETGFFNLYIHAACPYGDKINIISIDGASSDFSLLNDPTFKTFKIVNSLSLGAGQHTIQILKSWGWINIDYIRLEQIDPAQRFNLNQTLVTVNSTPEANSLYQFLLDNYGQKIISGVMTLNSFDESEWLKQNTGKEPALLGLDFMHCGRDYNWYNDMEPVNDAKTWYAKNGIPAICWHWRDPSRLTEEFYADRTNFDISKINDPNSAEYQAMIADIDYISGLLKELQNANVPVIWRPLHEAAGGWFWWGAKGAEPCKKLYQIMYDRMVNLHGLRNLIWVWTREPNDEAWYPGDEYVDIVGRDIYKTGDHGSHAIEFNNMNALYGGKKMLTISECGSFPDPDNLIADGAAWSWYMPWYGDFTRSSTYNSLELWQKAFAHDYVITLDDMPQLSTYGTVTADYDAAAADSEFLVYPTRVSSHFTVKGAAQLESIMIYNLQGELVDKRLSAGNGAVISCSGLKAGLYIVRINGIEAVKIVKD